MAQNNTEKVYDVFGNEVRGTSTKVHAHPGGHSSFSLGGGYGDDGAADRQRRQPGAAVPGMGVQQEEQKQAQAPGQMAAGAAGAGGAQAAAGSAVAATVGGVQEGAATEKVFDCFGNEVKGTSIRVHNPPGGKSSITF